MRAPSTLRRLWFRQNPHSLYVASAALFFAFTLVLDLFIFEQTRGSWLHWVLLLFCSVFVTTTLTLGERFPVSGGLFCVALFIAVSVFFLSPYGDLRSAVASAQELPILALYLGWFVKRPYGRFIMLATVALIVLGMMSNPHFQPEGEIGIAAAAQIVIITLLAFEVGSFLWWQSEKRVLTDSLTGALNRRAFTDHLNQSIKRSKRTALPLTLIAIDFDGFKDINDQKGHATGDRVLAEAVERWRLTLRREDTIGRLGGDEFGLIFPAAHLERAEQIMQRLRATAPYGWSWGAAQLQSSDTVETLIARADVALYQMKQAAS